MPASPVGAVTHRAQGSLADTVRAAYSTDAQFVILGDTDHGSKKLADRLLSRDVLIAAAEGGATDIYLELRPGYQASIDRLARGDITAEQYADETRDSNTHMSPDQLRAYKIETEAPAIQLAARMGMKVHAIDSNERLSGPDSVLDALHDSTTPEWRNDNRAEYNHMRHVGSKGQFEAYLAERSDADAGLAQRIGAISDGRKGLIVHGSAHGSYFNDLDEHLQGPSVKIDVYESGADIQAFRAEFSANPDDPALYQDYSTGDPDQKHMDEDKPELIVVLSDDGRDTVYQTPNKPDDLRAAVEPMGFSEDIEGQSVIDHAMNRAVESEYPSP